MTPQKIKWGLKTDNCAPVFAAAFSTVAHGGKNPCLFRIWKGMEDKYLIGSGGVMKEIGSREYMVMAI